MLELLHEWGIWYLPLQALAVVITAFVPPFPSEVMVIGSGALAAGDLLPLWAALAATIGGCFAGDVGLYLLFRYQLIRVLYRWRWGRRLHRMLIRATIRAGKTSTWIGLLLIRWIPGGRSTSMASAGIMRLSWPRLLILASLGAVTWGTWLVGLGYITGTTTGLPPLFSTLMGLAVGTLVAIVIALAVSRRRRARAQV